MFSDLFLKSGKPFLQPFSFGPFMLPGKKIGNFLHIFLSNASSIHLAGSFRELVGLIHDQCPVICQKRPVPICSVHGICQKIIVIADL